MKTFISYLLILLMLAPAAIARPEIRSAGMKCCTKMAGKGRQCHKQKEKKQSCPACASCPMMSVFTIPQTTDVQNHFAIVNTSHTEHRQAELSDFNSSVWRPPNAAHLP